MIDIKEIEKIDQAIEEFQKAEWIPADLTHFGRKIDWKKENKVFTAIEDGTLVGVLELSIQSGVMHIESLIVKHDEYRKGVGKMLMKKAEALASDRQLHKIYLETGKTWDATMFYEALGYKVTGELPNHLEKQDYVEYSKFLS